VRDADFVVEAVPEDLPLKRRVFDEIERAARPDAILARLRSPSPIPQKGGMPGLGHAVTITSRERIHAPRRRQSVPRPACGGAMLTLLRLPFLPVSARHSVLGPPHVSPGASAPLTLLRVPSFI